MSPADIITFSKVIETHEPEEPVSRRMAFQMLLGSVLILAEIEARGLVHIDSLLWRMADLRERMEDAIAREGK